MSALAIDLRRTAGFLVADARGRVVGTVECPMYGTSPETPDALSVRSGWLARRRRIVPADSIEQIDDGSKVIGLRVERDSILRGGQGFLCEIEKSCLWPRNSAGGSWPATFAA